MAGLGSDSENEVELLDLTTPLAPRPTSRSSWNPTAKSKASSPSSPSAFGSSRGGASKASGESDNDIDDNVFNCDYDEKPLEERLRARTAAAGSAVSDQESSSGDEIDCGVYSGGGKGKCKGKARDEKVGSSGGSSGASPSNNSVAGGDEDENADYAACTQESEVVDLLTDSDGGVTPGRSLLWSRGRGGKGSRATARASAEGDGSDSDDSRVYYSDRQKDDKEEPDVSDGEVDIPSDLCLDSLVMSSQPSSTNMSSATLSALGGGGAGARRSKASIPGGGGRGVGASGAAVEVDLVGVPDGSSDEESSSYGGGGTFGGSSSTAPKVLPSGDVEDAAAVLRENKTPARKEATANKKRLRPETAPTAKQQREQEQLARKHESDLAKSEKNAQKAAKKARDQQEKEEKKAERAAKKAREQREKEKKDAEREAKNERGRQEQEVACVMERRFFECARNARARAGATEQPGRTEKFMVAAGDCRAAGAIWWTRREHGQGAAAVSGVGVQTLDILVVVVHPETLLGRLSPPGAGGGREGGTGDVNLFPGLGQFVDGIRASAPGFSRLVLVLEGAKEALDAGWARSARGSLGKGPAGGYCTREEFEDAQCWLLIHKEVETRLTKDSEETGQYLWDLTKALSAIPYKDDVTELHCISKSKTNARGSEVFPKEEKELMDTWVKMLEQVQRVSSSRAIEFAANYPLPRDLVAALSDPALPEAERASLLANKTGDRPDKPLALRMFQLFTEEDGDFVLD